MNEPPSIPSVASPVRLSVRDRIFLLVRIWYLAARAAVALRRSPVGDVALAYGSLGVARRQPLQLLNRGVSRGLRVGPYQPRCLTRSLVLYQLLRAQGDPAELVIGLPDKATSVDAHAWVELHGQDVGPLPGSRGYRPLARFPRGGGAHP